MNLKELKEKKINELTTLAKKYNIESASSMRKQDLIFALMQSQSEQNGMDIRRRRPRDPSRRLRLPQGP